MIKKIRNAAKKILGLKWLQSEISRIATGTAIGHGAVELLTKLFNLKNAEIVLKDAFQFPSRVELFSFLLKLKEEDRHFYEERFREADTTDDTTNIPSLDDTIIALCSLLALREQRILLQDNSGEPILNNNGEPVYITKPGLNEKELTNLFSQYAQGGKESFWLWVKTLLTDEQLQKFRKIANQTKTELATELIKQAKEWYKGKKEEIEQKADEAMKQLDEQTQKSIEELKKLKF